MNNKLSGQKFSVAVEHGLNLDKNVRQLNSHTTNASASG
jgi:hypothetical protein